MDFLLQQTLNALQWGSFYALIALGYTLVYGVLRLINFAHGDIFMVGAYISFFVATYLVSSDGLGLSKPLTLWLTIVLTMGLTALVGVTLERIAYRPLRRKGAHRLYVVITALMCGLILENGNLALLGATKRKLPELIDKTVYSIGPLVITNLKVWVIVAAVLVFLFLQTIVTRTKVGMFRTFKQLNSEGLTVVVVEQNARLALQVADRGYVLDTGSIVAEGSAAHLADTPEIKAAYLGA